MCVCVCLRIEPFTIHQTSTLQFHQHQTTCLFLIQNLEQISKNVNTTSVRCKAADSIHRVSDFHTSCVCVCVCVCVCLFVCVCTRAHTLGLTE